MNAPFTGDSEQLVESLNELLMRLDRAVETLELMDELGVDSREELQALMDNLERQIDDAE